jgi:hypothetical protein
MVVAVLGLSGAAFSRRTAAAVELESSGTASSNGGGAVTWERCFD